MGDIHSGMRIETLSTGAGGGVEFTLARVVNGKADVSYGLHGAQRTHSLSGGVDRDDLLQWLGFRNLGCGITRDRETFCIAVDEEFDLDGFVSAFTEAQGLISTSDQLLQRCGFFLESREFPAKQWARTRGDGHSGSDQERLKESGDANFEYRLTFLNQNGQKGWTTHVRPKEAPISSEISRLFARLGLRDLEECIEFAFESCYWRNISYEKAGDSFFDANTNTVHGWYDHLSSDFSPAIEAFLAAEARLSEFGFSILPRSDERRAVRRPVATRSASPARLSADPSDEDDEFDVAISFAGSDRKHAEALATILRDRRIKVFYDAFYGSRLWGKRLTEFFDRIYRKQARFCVMFVSSEYRDRQWTTHERRSALSRAVEDKGREYILPIMVEPVDLDGLPPDVAYVALEEHSMEAIAEMLIEKIREG
ncbi:MAG: hypothetical protein CVU47_01300 [Chloroflexi bacterium HGW-Chloroflexi-9]|nr:MAG: hypothetical protein CVU47_01300 [Chloroflexi bacterium HGW-Chloroflexi-9]